MVQLRVMLRAVFGAIKNGKSGSGWLVVEDSGDIFVKNVWRSNPMGNVASLSDYKHSRKKVSFRNADGDVVKLHFKSKKDLRAFNTIVRKARDVSETSETSAPDVSERIRKLIALRDEGLISDQEFAEKKKSLIDQI